MYKGSLSHVVKAIEAAKKLKLEAYHGTPHEVDKFDSSKIGTGEGAQAYGHGLYFAQNPSVAGEYARELGTSVNVDGKPLMQKGKVVGTTGNPELDDYLIANIGDAKGARRDILESIRVVRATNPQAAKDYQKLLAELRKVDVNANSTGNLYKVELDIDPDTEMLDLDKPLSEQSNLSQKIQPNEVKTIIKDWEKATGEKWFSGNFYNQSGNEVNAALQDAYGVEKASKFLSSKGIKGIKYSDAVSRGTGQGTSNFVVFDDSLISIAEKNGIPFEQVTNLAKQKGVTNQQALTMLIGGSAIGAGMQSQEAEAGVIGVGKKLYRGLEKPFDSSYNLSSTDAPQGYSTWTDNPQLARQYAGDSGFVYEIELPKYSEGSDLIDNEGERALFVNNQKKAGLNNISGDEYLVYQGHDNFSPSMIKLSDRGNATTKQMAGASTVGAAGLGLQAFINKRKQRPNSLINRIGYVAEPLATVASGYASDVASGLVGVASLPFVGSYQAAKNIEAVQNTFGAWKPRTKGGNQAFEDIGGLIDQGAHMYNFTAKKTGFDPMANFNESAEGLHKAGLNAPAAILMGLPDIL